MHHDPLYTLDGNPADIYKRIQKLFQRAVARWPDLDGTSAKKLELGQYQLVQCLRPLIGWSLLSSDLTHLDATLERLVAKSSKAELGQYFTPRDVIKMCIEALTPNSRDTIIDPACGSGGFLYEAVRHCMQNGESPPKCLGIDLGAKAVRLAFLLSHVVRNQTILVSRGNSIDGRDYRDSYPGEWEAFLEDESKEFASGMAPWGAWNRLRCSLLLTNPPFAGAIDEPDVLTAYESQRQPGALRRGSVGREHLFLDRAVTMLSPGGRLAIVVPQGILANATSSYLRKWLLSKCRILAVVGLHPYAFLPNTGVKASVLFLEKPKRKADLQSDYNVFFATSRLPGKDSSGRPALRSDYEEIGTSLRTHFGTLGLSWSKPISSGSSVNHSVVPVAEAIQHDRMDAEYYDSAIRSLHRAMHRTTNQRISDVVAPSVHRFRANTPTEIEYVDISAVDDRTGIPVPSRIQSSEAPSRASYVLRQGDVLVSTVRPDRNIVGFMNQTSDLPIIASNGFCVLRSNILPPELLFAYCKTEAFRKLLSRRATATMYPAVTDRDVLDVPFVQPSEKVEEAVVQNIRVAIKMLEKAYAKIEYAITEMEAFLTSRLEPTLGLLAEDSAKKELSETKDL